MGISPTQLIIVLVIVALVFGTKKLRNMGGDIGGAVKGFKQAMHDKESAPLVTQETAEMFDVHVETPTAKEQA